MELELREESYKGETKGLNSLIREKGEIEIEIIKVNGAGALTLAKNGKKQNAKPFLLKHSTIM